MSELVEKKPVVRVAFLDVGQGDTIVITCPETHEAIIVDCIDNQAVLNYLKRENIQYLRGVVVTHPHADHYKGVADLLNNCAHKLGIEGCEVFASSEDISDFKSGVAVTRWLPDDDKHSTMYDVSRASVGKSALAKLYHWTADNEDKCGLLRDVRNVTLPFAGTLARSLHLLHPPHIHYTALRSKLNNVSAVLQVVGNGSSALLMGDLEYAGWQSLLARYPDVVCDVLKFPHHGGTWSEKQAGELLSSLRPSKVIISVGSDNMYGHPASEVFTAVHKQNDVQLLCTQATKACMNGLPVDSEIPAITRKFQDQAVLDGSFVLASRGGHCPCAGTIVVELGDEARVLQPALDFHHSEVINAHFREHHRCRVVSPVSPALR